MNSIDKFREINVKNLDFSKINKWKDFFDKRKDSINEDTKKAIELIISRLWTIEEEESIENIMWKFVEILDNSWNNEDAIVAWYIENKMNQSYTFKRFFKIISKLKEKINQFKKNSLTDPLTWVYNRRYANKKLKENFNCFERCNENFAIAMLDIDDFKNINDTYWHDVWDKVLISFTKKINDNSLKKFSKDIQKYTALILNF